MVVADPSCPCVGYDGNPVPDPDSCRNTETGNRTSPLWSLARRALLGSFRCPARSGGGWSEGGLPGGNNMAC